MLWTFEFKAADVNKLGKRKKRVRGDFWGAMLPISRISPAQLARLPLLLPWLLSASSLKTSSRSCAELGFATAWI